MQDESSVNDHLYIACLFSVLGLYLLKEFSVSSCYFIHNQTDTADKMDSAL